MLLAALVFIGAGIGGVVRYAIGVQASRLFSFDFPWATMAINILGSFLMGVIAAWFVLRPGPGGTQELRIFLTTGVLGGFTTFSTFSLDAIYLWERGAPMAAALYVGGSLVLGLAGLAGGLALVRALAG
ncbi:MAG TPA: fluoride efflux transporter CrcB [Kaistia sp.]|nr:fluoride efflux transporter CrcB [Kaistia sp.]